VNLAEFVANNAQSRASAIAVSDDDGDLTYAALEERIRRTATQLARRGVAAGDVVGVCLRDDARTIVLWLALGRLGAAFIPMDWRWTPEEQAQIGRVFRPRIVFLEPGRNAAADLPVIRHDETWSGSVDETPAEDRMAAGGDQPFVMSMSSGTTGLPRGNVHTHDSFHALVRTHWLDLGQGADERSLVVMSLSSAAGRSAALATILIGGNLIVPPPLLAPEELIAMVQSRAVDILYVVPAILRGILGLAIRPTLLLPELGKLMTVGSMLFPEESRRIRDRVNPNLYNYYGSTGGGINTVLHPRELDQKAGSIGRPCFENEIEVVDEENRTLPNGETGRLRVRSPNTCWGTYPPDPDDGSYFEGWHYPGDYALIDEDGYVFLQGRYADIIIRGGSNVYAPEVERALLVHDGISEAAVIGAPNDQRDEDVIAFIVGDASLATDDILRHCRTRLAAYKIPARIRLVKELPRNSAGKVLKRRLLEMYSDR